MGAQSVSTRLLSKQSDGRLLELLAQGHEHAFEAIVLRYRAELLSYCERLGLSDARAEDALQHALLKAWLALQAGSEVRELRAWLYRIVHNTAVNVMRRCSEERALDLDAALIEAAAAAPETELERATAAREALAHVAALPQMQRHAMLLSALEGRTHEDIAGALGISDVAVRGLLYRARVTLRAAAAALTPAPLIGWCTQAANRIGARTGLAQLALGGEPTGAGGVLLKGTALAATAALAAGAVLGPLRGHHVSSAQAHVRRSTKASSGAARALAQEASSSRAPLVPLRSPTLVKSNVSLPGATPRSVGVRSGSGVSLMRRPSVLIAPRSSVGGGQGTSAPLPSRPAPAPAAAATPVKAVLAEGAPSPPAHGGTSEGAGSSPSPTGGSGGGSSPPVSGGAPEAPKAEGPPRSEHEEEAAQEKAENEREAAKERAEQEAEAAHEKAEREAEAASGGD